MLRQGMSLGSCHLDFVTENTNHFHAAPRVRQRDDTQLHLAFLNFLQNLVAEIPIDADLDQRVKLLEPRKGLGKDVQAGSLVGPDVQLAARRLVQLGDGLERLFLEAEQALGVALKDFSGGCELNLLAAPVKKFLTALLLEQPHLGADRRLGAEELFRRPPGACRRQSRPRGRAGRGRARAPEEAAGGTFPGVYKTDCRGPAYPRSASGGVRQWRRRGLEARSGRARTGRTPRLDNASPGTAWSGGTQRS